MSSIEVENMASRSLTGNGKAKKMAPVFGERKRLQTIQLSSEQNHLTRVGEAARNGKKEDKVKKIPQYYKPVTVYVDPEPSSEQSVSQSTEGSTCQCLCHNTSTTFDTKSTSTEDNDMIDFMTAEPELEEWKDLAESRREALEESLIENQQLHFEVSDYKTQLTSFTQEMSEMEQENRRLSQQRDYFAGILQKLVDEDEDSSTETSSDSSTVPPPDAQTDDSDAADSLYATESLSGENPSEENPSDNNPSN